MSSTHVFLREDRRRGALQPAYSGPHKVIQRNDKVFKIAVKGKEVTVSLDRLKPAYILADSSPTKQLNKKPTVNEPPTPPQIIKTTPYRQASQIP
ncbi:hypothetical protein EVAR_56144_1 [Eumeta japonica]|uniref:Uncharacterized protein n=1 Tax=Eumeta variegata TaxID=151549 RepID=A0A4C1Y7E6_EUMVA|nr:hypothetical protein EVAR_56144_1 [Eumeta japonica]